MMPHHLWRSAECVRTLIGMLANASAFSSLIRPGPASRRGRRASFPQRRLSLPSLKSCMSAGNFRLLSRLLTQIERILKVNEFTSVSKEIVAAARDSLVIGQA